MLGSGKRSSLFYNNSMNAYHRFERIYLDTTWGLAAQEISWKLMDPMQTTHRFEGFF
jgi:hypothetical protein